MVANMSEFVSLLEKGTQNYSDGARSQADYCFGWISEHGQIE